jgi:hypothetical protein
VAKAECSRSFIFAGGVSAKFGACPLNLVPGTPAPTVVMIHLEGLFPLFFVIFLRFD